MAEKNTQQNNGNMHSSEVLLRPYLTEKAVGKMDDNVYIFEVSSRANKIMIKSAIKTVYDVDPVKIAIVNTKPKTKRSPRTGKIGKTRTFKKAYVYLKKGDSISIM